MCTKEPQLSDEQPQTTGRNYMDSLVMRAMYGDRYAWDEIVYRIQGRLLRYAFSVVANWDEAEDCVQVGFTKFWKHSSQYQDRIAEFTHLRNFAIACVRNECRTLLRKNHRWDISLDEPIDISGDNPTLLGDQTPSDALSPEDEVVGKERDHIVRQAVERLPANQRELIYLHYMEGLSYQEIAAITGKSQSKIKSDLHRAIKALRLKLEFYILEA